MKLAAIFSLTAAIIYILFESLHPAYYLHLYPDVFAFFARATYFWQNFSLHNLGFNEYQPGAITFFISLTPVFLIDTTIETFKWALFSANILFLFLISFLLIRMEKTEGVFLLSIILVLLGPILLFRFDLLVILLTFFCFFLWEKNRKIPAMFILALGVITKVYPIIFLPYLLFQNFKNKTLTSSLYLLLCFSGSLLLLLSLYTFIFNISLSDTLLSYNFHGNKSVATESVWASGIYFFSFINSRTLPPMESAYGINAIARKSVYPSIQFYNYFWILPVGLLYLLYFLKNKSWKKLDTKFLTFIVLIFLIFSKVLSNQYLAWFLFMIPLIDKKLLLSKIWVCLIFLIFITTIMHTYIYPLNYSEWLGSLNGGPINPFLLWTLLVSNFILILIGIGIGIEVYKKNDK